MKRAISGKHRGGSPPLPRQRKALRVTQLTFIGLSAAAGKLALGPTGSGSPRLVETIGLWVFAAFFLGIALWMGLRTVRGPEPPSLD